MARVKTSPSTEVLRLAIARRLVELRIDLCGERGAAQFATRIGLASSTWRQYEKGQILPGETILRVIEITDAEPIWLLRGNRPKYRPGGHDSPSRQEHRAISKLLIRVALALTERGIAFVPDEPTWEFTR